MGEGLRFRDDKGGEMKDQFKDYDRWRLQAPDDIDEAIELRRKRQRDEEDWGDDYRDIEGDEQ